MDCGASAYCDGARRRRRDGRGARGAYGGVGARRAGAGAAAAGVGARGLGPGQCCGWGGAGRGAQPPQLLRSIARPHRASLSVRLMAGGRRGAAQRCVLFRHEFHGPSHAGMRGKSPAAQPAAPR